MRFLDYIFVALKNLWRQKSRTFLTVSAVVIGAVSVILMLSLVIGARQVFVKQIESIGGLSLISVTGNVSDSGGDSLFNGGSSGADDKKINDAAIKELKAVPHVAGVTPLANVWINYFKLENGEKKVSNTNLVGVDPSADVLNMNVSSGRALRAGDLDKVVIGGRVLKGLGYSGNGTELIGKKLLLGIQGQTTDWEADPALPGGDGKDDQKQYEQIRTIPAEIVGVMASGMDDGSNYITMDWAHKLMTSKYWKYDDTANQALKEQTEQQIQALNQERKFNPVAGKNYDQLINELQKNNQFNLQVLVKQDNFEQKGYGAAMVKADSTDNVKAVGEAITKLNYGVTTAQEMLDGISKIFLAVGLVFGAIGGIALFVAAIGIINTMAMAIYERTREIGVMRACGATKFAIRRLFTFEAALIGLFGGGVGLLISYIIAQIGNYVAGHYAVSLSIPIEDLISLPLWLVVATLVFTTFIGWLAGVIPAMRAARLDPVEALRYE